MEDIRHEGAPVRTALTVATVGVAALVALAWGAQRKLIYFPTQDLPPVTGLGVDVEEVSFPTDDGLSLGAWMVPPAAEANGITIVVLHGNGGNRADRLPLASAFAERGYRVLLTDYRGYGGNPGNPTEVGLADDARAAIAYLASRPDVDPERIVYFGESLGSAVAIGLSMDVPPAALVLRSPFTSLSDVASAHYPYLPSGLLLRDRYASIEAIGALDVPLLIIAGTDDTIVPYRQSQELFDAATGPKRFITVEGADHNDPELAFGVGIIDDTAIFLDEYLAPRP